MRVKHFKYTHSTIGSSAWGGGKSIDDQINEFLENNHIKVVDIKYSGNVSYTSGKTYNGGDTYEKATHYSALLMYEEGLEWNF